MFERIKHAYIHGIAYAAFIAAIWHHRSDYVITANLVVGIVSFTLTCYMIPRTLEMFVNAGLTGHDVNKKKKPLM
jgi:divalent metal cation (Fe/Co/Zn/Cd) transporter